MESSFLLQNVKELAFISKDYTKFKAIQVTELIVHHPSKKKKETEEYGTVDVIRTSDGACRMEPHNRAYTQQNDIQYDKHENKMK